MPTLSIVVAVAANRVIGRNGALPWHLSEDLRHFKKVTMGKPIIMGRRTWDSIGKPLPGRRNIVVTSNAHFNAPGTERAHSLAEALHLAEPAHEVAVIGGARLFAEALPIADILYLTEIHADYEGDTFFPQWNREEWREIERHEHPATDTAPGFTFLTLKRAQAE
ncbi:MAG: dihydrofolate reductase [Kiritimatiellae bacterium]|nr:dihydrofolate reductase [Kiritimatiellia bacterium]MCO5067629.1 dihydrofolate reductase [Kiritimatiellia bacterium]